MTQYIIFPIEFPSNIGILNFRCSVLVTGINGGLQREGIV